MKGLDRTNAGGTAVVPRVSRPRWVVLYACHRRKLKCAGAFEGVSPTEEGRGPGTVAAAVYFFCLFSSGFLIAFVVVVGVLREPGTWCLRFRLADGRL
mmetsp:Transcript_12194/g.17980  ORF Transcript_12194/g.17980 Transcript_12194/m.17980 type:complete len:98 (-) Transcript_12194:168-461(-)